MTSIHLAPGSRFLFQGDSITDGSRNRPDPASLGSGYAVMVAGRAMLRYTGRQLTFLNRGISGNRAGDLVARWTDDAIALRPDVVSILIGINDVWRRFDRNDPTPAETYERNYRLILERLRGETKAKIILLEPFLLPVPGKEAWREDLDPKRAVARRLAGEFADVFVPLDDLFRARVRDADPAYWAGDGVHPSPAGHALIAEALLDCLA
jgi:acyl-CoA thioesterase-1